MLFRFAKICLFVSLKQIFPDIFLSLSLIFHPNIYKEISGRSFFLVFLQQKQRQQQQRKKSTEMGSDCSSSGAQEFHVLAVDDSLVDRKVIEKLLKISCCKVTAVESGRRALQYLGLDGERGTVGFDELKINLIMTDYSMPGMTGFELLKKIKGSSKLRDIPVVVMSSENMLTRIDSCLEEGAEEFLVKPVKLSDVERLRDFISRGVEKSEMNVSSRKRKMPESLALPIQPASLSSSSSSLGCDHHQQLLPKHPRLLEAE